MPSHLPQFFLPFLLTISFWPGILSPATSPRWWILAIGLVIALPLPRLERIPNDILILLTLSFLSLFLSINSPSSIGELIHFFLLYLAFIWGMSLTWRQFANVIWGFTAGLAINSTIALFQTFGWQWIPSWESAVPAGLFYNREVLAELAAPILVWGIISADWKIILPSIIPIILCQSRIAGMVVVGGILLNIKSSVLRFSLSLGTVIAITISFYLPFKIQSLLSRFDIWEFAASQLNLFGHGLDSWQLLYPESQFVHSDVLQLLFELGILPTIPLLLLPIVILWKSSHAKTPSPYLPVAGVILIESVLSFPLHQPALAALGAILFGHLASPHAGNTPLPCHPIHHPQPVRRTNLDQIME